VFRHAARVGGRSSTSVSTSTSIEASTRNFTRVITLMGFFTNAPPGARARHDEFVPRVRVVQDDITRLAVDAIVNAANSSLLGGGGVDAAIHRAAGPGLLAECRRLGGCAVGDAKATAGHDLPARWVIHTVGPRWRGGNADEPELLASCYRRSLAVAAGLGARTVAFPAISTGIYGYPPDRAADVAVAEVSSDAGAALDEIVLVAFDRATLALYEERLGRG
jgi:O-acetyl-ADP-ribose deacetylase (regulator of RNase III)